MILGIGVDVVEIDRIAAAAEHPRFASRILTVLELEALAQEPDRVRFLAGRWAMKEAIKKACPWLHSWHAAEITRGTHGEPRAHVFGIDHSERVHVSLTHERGLVVAMALREQYYDVARLSI
ncbi:MAG: holo-ACP synthase [Chthonomonas sp.]|nr:holo-ACP synthase [Chthonomonas sp.]